MTVKLLSDRDRNKLIRAAKLAHMKEEYPKGRPKDNEYGEQDEYDEQLENYDPLDDAGYGEECVHIEEFPMCCGANVLCDFPFGKLSPQEQLEITLAVDSSLRNANSMVVAILNAEQQPHLKHIMLRFGGKCYPKTVKGHHNFNLYLWVFLKGKARAKKKVF